MWLHWVKLCSNLHSVLLLFSLVSTTSFFFLLSARYTRQEYYCSSISVYPHYNCVSSDALFFVPRLNQAGGSEDCRLMWPISSNYSCMFTVSKKHNCMYMQQEGANQPVVCISVSFLYFFSLPVSDMSKLLYIYSILLTCMIILFYAYFYLVFFFITFSFVSLVILPFILFYPHSLSFSFSPPFDFPPCFLPLTSCLCCYIFVSVPPLLISWKLISACVNDWDHWE